MALAATLFAVACSFPDLRYQADDGGDDAAPDATTDTTGDDDGEAPPDATGDDSAAREETAPDAPAEVGGDASEGGSVVDSTGDHGEGSPADGAREGDVASPADGAAGAPDSPTDATTDGTAEASADATADGVAEASGESSTSDGSGMDGAPTDSGSDAPACDQDGDQDLAPGPICGGNDCDDHDNRAFFGEPDFLTFTPTPVTNGDWNCNGVLEKQYPTNVNCGVINLGQCDTTAGFSGDPACGSSASFVQCQTSAGLLCVAGTTTTKTQGCK